MKLLIISDLHGHKPRIKDKDFDAIIVPGDVCSDKEFKPVYRAWFRHLKKENISADEYFKRHFTKKQLKGMDTRALQEGRKIMKYLDSFNKPVFFVPGNHDQSYGSTRIKNMDSSSYNYRKAFYDFWAGKMSNPKLTNGLKNVRDCQYKAHELDGITFVGYGLSSAPEDPAKKYKMKKYTNEEYKKLKGAYEKIKKQLANEMKKVKKGSPVVFISHNVPHGSKLDVITDKKSYAYKMHLGSTVADWFVKKYQPLICIGGHIHDHYGTAKDGKTTILNTGFGGKITTLVEIKNKKLNKIKLTGKPY